MNIPKDDLFFDLLRSGLWDKAGTVADYSSVDWKALISNNKKRPNSGRFFCLSGYSDSNTGPSGPKPDALANCATPR